VEAEAVRKRGEDKRSSCETEEREGCRRPGDAQVEAMMMLIRRRRRRREAGRFEAAGVRPKKLGLKRRRKGRRKALG